MPKSRTVRAFSAGGVVFRRASIPDRSACVDVAERLASATTASPPAPASPLTTAVDIVLVGRASEEFWVLPKGTPAPNETIPEVALREVREETGVTARIIAELGSIHYWFVRKGVRFNKEVFYYLMEATGGDVSLHDHEYDDARWFAIGEAQSRLTYANEAEMVRRAAVLIAQRPHADDER